MFKDTCLRGHPRTPENVVGKSRNCRICRNERPSDGPKRLRVNRSANKLRNEVMEGYGAVCSCCGEDNRKFLTLDHVDGGGTQERKKHGGLKAYRDARDNSFPSKYKLLCYNCNTGRYFNGGVCPHMDV